MRRALGGVVTLLLACSPAHAALSSRAGGQAYYDTATNLTWVADANLAATTGYDPDGLLTWTEALGWVASLNAASHLGANDWRLPTVTDTGVPGCVEAAFSGTDCGYNVDPATGEMARMFASTLGNLPLCTPAGSCPQPGWGLTSTGPFENLQADVYWSGTQYAPIGTISWYFDFNEGLQFYSNKSDEFYAWAVRTGDIEPPPPDTDGDGVADPLDNCITLSNATQCDSDSDGYGNRCDGDMNNNGATNAQDTVLFRQRLGQPSVAPSFNKADLNCNGSVNAQDTVLYRQLLGQPPGPSGLVP